MNRLSMLLLLGSMLIAIPVCSADVPGLRVELTADRESVPNLGQFAVTATIRNEGLQNEPLQFWTCSYYESWIVDEPSVTLDTWPCDKNPLRSIVLKPGDVHENAGPLKLSIGVPAEEILQDRVTFRLGFKRNVLNIGDITQPILWSNPVTIQVTE